MKFQKKKHSKNVGRYSYQRLNKAQESYLYDKKIKKHSAADLNYTIADIYNQEDRDIILNNTNKKNEAIKGNYPRNQITSGDFSPRL